MDTAYVVITVLVALMAAFSGLEKIRLDPHQVKVIPRNSRRPAEALSAPGSV